MIGCQLCSSSVGFYKLLQISPNFSNIFIKKYPHVSGPAQFKPTFSKGPVIYHLYFPWQLPLVLPTSLCIFGKYVTFLYGIDQHYIAYILFYIIDFKNQ